MFAPSQFRVRTWLWLQEDVLWKSYLFNLKAGTMKFLITATIDTLPTA